ncbi:unnamed protein product [Lymnaea stagnalis]|uniref:Uncharacterized protein n=1 Tax=Lymnaea stagnalis TaxID=6523 RepID=A0AAV2HR27_LYMST
MFIFHAVMGPDKGFGWLRLFHLVLLCKPLTSSFLCDPSVTPNITNKTPRLPNITSSYVAYMEVWNSHSQKIGYMEEYVDQDNNMAAVRQYGQYDPGDVYTHITDYNTSQVFTIAQTNQGVTCTVTEINSYDVFILPYNLVNNKKHLVSTSALLQFGGGLAMSYLGPEQVRGKAADHWQGCSRDNITLVTTMNDIYFTANGWGTANSEDPTPLLTKMTQLIPSPGQEFQESIQRDFVFFQTSIRDRSIFQLPSAMYCEGRKSSKPFPNIPDNFQFQSEFIALHLHEVGRYDVWYNKNAKLVRTDSKPLPGDGAVLKFSPRTTIRDYNTGIEYITDLQTGGCEVTPVVPDRSSSLLVDFRLVGMMSPIELFNLDKDNFTYSGQTVVRGINTDTWIGKRTGLDSEENTTFIWTWHFTTDEWSSIRYGEDMKTVPIQLAINSAEKDLHYVYNIYDFSPNDLDLNIFDVTSCYRDVDYHQIHFCLEGDPKVASNLPRLFENQLANTLADVMAVSVLRISNVKPVSSSTGACVTFTLYDSPNVTLGTVSNLTSTSDSISALKKFMDMRTKILFTDNNVSTTFVGVPWSVWNEIHYANGSVIVFSDPLVTTSVVSTEDVHWTSTTTLSVPPMTTTTGSTDKKMPPQSASPLVSSALTREVTQASARETTQVQAAKQCVSINEHSQEQFWSIGRIAGLSVGLCLGGVLIGVILARFTSKCKLNVKLKRSERFTRGGLDYSMM